jgi:hypothetical protein
MKHIMYFFFSCMVSLDLHAESSQYQLKGKYRPDFSKQKIVDFILRWSEENGNISGSYQDNYFTQPGKVTGNERASGRIFEVLFPEKKNEIKSLIILTSVARHPATAMVVPLGIVTRDQNGNLLSMTKSTAEMVITSFRSLAQLQEEGPCLDGFGALGGYCGVYAGVLAEEQDRRNRCNLLFSDAIRLELTQEGMLILHLGEVNDFITSASHTIGRLPVNPQKSSIDLMSRICAPLTGVNSSSSSCKILHLKGIFSQIKDLRHFRGEYTIHEEGTNNLCRYSLSMDKI